MREKILYVILILLASVILNQAVSRLETYMYNRQYDTRLHQKAWEKELREKMPLKRR